MRSTDAHNGRLLRHNRSGLSEYFVTIHTKGRRRLLGETINGTVQLTTAGRIVDVCWRLIPAQFPQVTLGPYQVLPDGVHGLIALRFPRGRVSPHSQMLALRRIIDFFERRATRLLAGLRGTQWRNLFRNNYHEHSVRDDIDQYFVQQYLFAGSKEAGLS